MDPDVPGTEKNPEAIKKGLYEPLRAVLEGQGVLARWGIG
jgi:hypothetical protein